MHWSLALLVVLVVLSPFTGGCRRAAQPAAAPAAAPPAPPPVPPPPAYTGPVVEVPAGSRLVMRLDDNVDSGKGAGVRFRASLEAALLDSSGKTIVPAGTKVLGIILESKSAGNVVGRSELELAFTDLEINGMLFPIQSQGVQAVGEGSGRDTGKKVAAGALVGAAFGGGSGAAKGAAIGGAAALVTRGKQIRIPSGTILELSLVSPARVPASNAVAATGAPSSEVAATPAPAAAPAPTTVTAGAPPPTDDAQKACVKKLMANGFSADEALSSCKSTK
jgi:hypothetical protein